METVKCDRLLHSNENASSERLYQSNVNYIRGDDLIFIVNSISDQILMINGFLSV